MPLLTCVSSAYYFDIKKSVEVNDWNEEEKEKKKEKIDTKHCTCVLVLTLLHWRRNGLLTRQTWVGYWIRNKVFGLASKSDISRLGTQCAYIYFPEDITYTF
jgi:hypothetical protein